MGYDISPLKEGEIDEFNDVVWEAFDMGAGLTSCFYPGGYTPTTQAYLRDNTLNSLSDPNTDFMVVRDSDTKALMAIARWQFQTEDKSLQTADEADEAARRERASKASIDGINLVAIDGFRNAQAKAKREVLQGKAHAKLDVLATHPDQQRRGAGTVALDWGLQKADALGLPAYLEATSVGRPLYLKFGFKDVVELPFDARDYGHSHPVSHSCMLRDAAVQR